MDFTQFLTAKTLGWAMVGIPLLIGLMAILRLFRELSGGQKSYSTRHTVMDKRIHKTAQELEEFNKTIGKNEQLHILARALQEALMVNSTHNAQVEESEDFLRVQVNDKEYCVVFKESKQFLQSVHKTVYGQGHFEIYEGMDRQVKPLKSFYDLRETELYLQQILFPQRNSDGPPALRKK